MMPPPLALKRRHPPPPPPKDHNFLTDPAPSYPNTITVTAPNLAVRAEILTIIKSTRSSQKC